MRLIVLLASVAGLCRLAAADQSASVEKIGKRMPGWLRIGADTRLRYENLQGIGFVSGQDDYFLERLRFDIGIRPSNWLRFAFQAQDARVFGSWVRPAPANRQDGLDLRLGYAQFGVSEGPAVLTIGRQGLSFGEGRLVSDPDWGNVGRVFDAARLSIRHKWAKVDLFSGAPDQVFVSNWDRPNPAERFHGAYGSINTGIPGWVLEPYYLVRTAREVKAELARTGEMLEYTAGLRSTGKLPGGFDYGIETAFQWGSIGSETLNASASHWRMGFSFPDPVHVPRLYAEWNYGSGDSNPRDGVRGSFDPLYPGAHDKLGLADAVAWTNIHHARVGSRYRLRPHLTIGLAYNWLWLADLHDGLYSGSRLLVKPAGSQDRFVGQEPDVLLQWMTLGGIQIDLAYGRVLPGGFLKESERKLSFNSVVPAFGRKF